MLHSLRSSQPRTLLTLDVKPYDAECDLNELTSRLKSNADLSGGKFTVGWKETSLVEIGFGIKKLRIQCVVDSDDVDDLCDFIAEIEEDEVRKYNEQRVIIREIIREVRFASD